MYRQPGFIRKYTNVQYEIKQPQPQQPQPLQTQQPPQLTQPQQLTQVQQPQPQLKRTSAIYDFLNTKYNDNENIEGSEDDGDEEERTYKVGEVLRSKILKDRTIMKDSKQKIKKPIKKIDIKNKYDDIYKYHK